MIIRNDRQRARICRALLSAHATPAQLDRLFTLQGPTEHAHELAQAGGGLMSSGERLMFLAAWAVWTDGRVEGATFGEYIRVLDNENLRRLGKLLVHMSAEDDRGLEAWLDELDEESTSVHPAA